MTNALLDTDIVVDLWRAYPPAIQWATQNHNLTFGITSIVWLEVVQGARDKQAQLQAIKSMQHFEVVNIEPIDCDWTMQYFPNYYLSHNIGIHDMLNAAVAVRLTLSIYTRNLKHYLPLPNVLSVAPY